jgi:hypothetical protein
MALTWLYHAEVPDLKPRKVMATFAGTSSTAMQSPKGAKRPKRYPDLNDFRRLPVF